MISCRLCTMAPRPHVALAACHQGAVSPTTGNHASPRRNTPCAPPRRRIAKSLVAVRRNALPQHSPLVSSMHGAEAEEGEREDNAERGWGRSEQPEEAKEAEEAQIETRRKGLQTHTHTCKLSPKPRGSCGRDMGYISKRGSRRPKSRLFQNALTTPPSAVPPRMAPCGVGISFRFA